MMIDDLDDFDLIGPHHRLRKFVVIDQDQFAVERLKKIGLSTKCPPYGRPIKTGNAWKVGSGGARRTSLKRSRFVEGKEIFVEHMSHGNGSAAKRQQWSRYHAEKKSR